jgi:hypothetical protein
MNIIDTFKAFFKTPKVASVAIAVHDAFRTACDSYHAADDAIQSYTTRANHRSAIWIARRALYKTCDANAYDKAVAAYTDPVDFAPYTEAYLDAHTAAMENLDAAFDTLTDAFAAFSPSADLYNSAVALYKVYCDTYKFAATAYWHAASCAMITALEGNVQEVEDRFRIGLLEAEASHATATNAAPAKVKAVAFKAKAAEEASKAKQLEQNARIAENKAEVFLAKAGQRQRVLSNDTKI